MEGVSEPPKKLRRILKRLEAEGDEPVLIAPALLQRYATRNMIAMATMGMMDKVFSYLITTRKNVHLIRLGLAWDKVHTVPLERINDVEYVDEFRTNTMILKIQDTKEKIIFYDDLDGIKFYKYIKYKQWQN